MPADARAADHDALRPAHAHPPLAVMLVLTQMAVGALAFDVVRGGSAVVAAAAGVLALAASTLHLGRPQYAFRAVLGIGHSWLSREIVAFGVFAVAAPAYALTGSRPIGVAALVAGVAGIACSVMLYAITGRAWWRWWRSTIAFTLSAIVTGGVVTAGAAPLVAAAMAVKLVREVAVLRHRGADDVARAARLLRGDLWGWFQLRVLFGASGAAVALLSTHVAVMIVAATFVVAGELIERNQFFQVAVAPRMPGELR